jgi:putative peptide zinc metalloprotease protein
MDGPDGLQTRRLQIPTDDFDAPPAATKQPPRAPERSLSWSSSDGIHQLDLGDREIVIGRSPEVTIELHDPLVSRRHARVFLDSGEARLQDLGSANGTFLNGEQIKADVLLHTDDVIRLGSTELTFQEVVSAPPPPPDPLATRVLSVPSGEVERSTVPCTLYLRTGPGSPRVIAWDRSRPFSIGRAEGNSLAVDDPVLSRHHAELVSDGDHFFVSDLGTANGTFLNWARIRGRQSAQPGDAIQMGGLELIIDPAPEAPSAALAFGGEAERPTVGLSGPGTVTIGRDPAGTIHVDDEQVSWHQAQITPLFDDHVLFDLQSQNGTFLNDVRIESPVILRPGDSIRIGQTALVYERELRPGLHGASVAPQALQLRQVKPFDELEEPLFDLLVPAFTAVEYRSGDVILARPEKRAKGDREAMYVILQGEASVTAAVKGDWGAAVELTRLTPGSYCGERTAALGQPFPHEVIARTDVRALRLTKKAFDQRAQGEYKLTRFFKNRVAPLGTIKYLRTVPLFSQLPEAAWEELVKVMKQQSFVVGEVVARRGEACRAFLLIVSGRARANKLQDKRERLLTYLEEGKFVGEEVAGSDEVYPLSVIAETDVEALTLTREKWESIRMRYMPRVVGSDSDERGSELPSSVILHKVAPFDTLPPELITPLVERLREKHFDPGEVIVRQGEGASAFYIVERGTADVRMTESTGRERSTGTVKAGEYFGELSLITEQERDDSVIAAEPTTLLALYRSDFYDVLQQGKRYGMGLGFFASINKRTRPKRIADVEIVKHETGTGQISYILHNLRNDKYMSLTEQGLFVWNMMTGDYTLTDIAVAYSSQFHTFSMEGLFGTFGQLQRLGFLEIDQQKLLRLMPDIRLTPRQRVLLTLSKAFRWSYELKHADGLVARVHGALGWLLYARPVLVLYVLLSAVGVPAYVYALGHRPKSASLGGLILIGFVLAYILSIFLHEWGHALTVKQMGRRVVGGGLGWMYVSPYVYVNTSDMWLAGKWPRIAVTWAGPTVNLIIGSAASLAAVAATDATVSRFLTQLATINFIFVLANLNPLMELDGYYLLMDWLEIPGLRRKALGFLGAGDFKQCMKERAWSREQKIFAVFGVLIVLYLLLALVQNTVIIRSFFQSGLQHVFGEAGGLVAVWTIILLLSALLILPLVGEMRRWRSP